MTRHPNRNAVERPRFTEQDVSNTQPISQSSNNNGNLINEPNTAESPTCSSVTVIHADLLIPGRGPPLHSAAAVLEDGKIAFVGPYATLPSKYTDARHVSVPVLMPGLWDCHVHLAGTTNPNLVDFITVSGALAGARLARSAQDTLMAGYTSVRDLGGYAIELSKAIEEGVISGPNIYSAGAAISQTAGHGDAFELPVGIVLSASSVNGNGFDSGCRPMCMADGVDECRKAVRLQIRRGAKVIKVFASGGVLSRDDDPHFQQFSDEELKVMVDEAARMKLVVAAHVHGKDGIMAALRAGCATLEHGTYMDDEVIELMKEKGTILVATRTIVQVGMKHLDMLDPAQRAKMIETAKAHSEMYKRAVKSGIKIALGTDLVSSLPGHPFAHGLNGLELGYAVDAGMTPLEAIEAGTANGPLTLGSQAPKSGQICVGYDADVIAVSTNPLKDITVLAKPESITHVWKDGKLEKKPGLRPVLGGSDWR